jgi:hypothetical protein
MLMEHLADINTNRKLPYSDPRKYDNSKVLMQMISQSSSLHFADFMDTRGILLQLFSRFLQGAVVNINKGDNRLLKATKYVRDNIDERYFCRSAGLSLLYERRLFHSSVPEGHGDDASQLYTTKKDRTSPDTIYL